MHMDELLAIPQHPPPLQSHDAPDSQINLVTNPERHPTNSTLDPSIQQAPLPASPLLMPDPIRQIRPRNRLCAGHEYHLFGHDLPWQ